MEIDIQKNVLEANDTQADINRKYFKEKNVFVLNMMSSPGSGKTQTLCKTFETLLPDIRTGVIVGDNYYGLAVTCLVVKILDRMDEVELLENPTVLKYNLTTERNF